MTLDEQIERIMEVTTSADRQKIILLCKIQKNYDLASIRLNKIREAEVQRKQEWAEKIRRNRKEKASRELPKEVVSEDAKERKYSGRKGIRAKQMDIKPVVI